MQNYEYNPSAPVQEVSFGKIDVRPLMRMVYLWMGLGLLVTAFVALFMASSVELIQVAQGLFLPAIIGQFAFVLALGWAINRISANVALVLFFLYAASMGLTLSLIVFV
jgi:FtsH-binding integral membrane protein